MNLQAIKENWLFFVVIAAGLVGYMEIRLHNIAQAEFDGLDIPSADKIEAIESDIIDLEKADDRMDGKIERIVDILLED